MQIQCIAEGIAVQPRSRSDFSEERYAGVKLQVIRIAEDGAHRDLRMAVYQGSALTQASAQQRITQVGARFALP